MSIWSQAFSVIIYLVISVLGDGREVVYGPNSTKKRFLLQLMSTVQLPGANIYYTQMVSHTETPTSDVSFAREFQKHLSTEAHKHRVIDQGKNKKQASKQNWTER